MFYAHCKVCLFSLASPSGELAGTSQHLVIRLIGSWWFNQCTVMSMDWFKGTSWSETLVAQETGNKQVVRCDSGAQMMAMFIIHQWWWLGYGQLNWATCLDIKWSLLVYFPIHFWGHKLTWLWVVPITDCHAQRCEQFWATPMDCHSPSRFTWVHVYGYSPYRFCQAPQHSQGETWWTTSADNGDSSIDIISSSYQINQASNC